MKLQLSFIKFVWVCSFLGGVLNAQVFFNKPKMDSLLDVYEQKNKLMLTMAISSNEQVIYKRAIGYSWNEADKKLESNTLTKYRIGSITKTFTAVMILQLIEEKKLKLSTTLSKFFPKFPNAKKISIEHLLKHRTGIHNFTDDPEFIQYMYQAKTQKELMDILMKLPSDFEPDVKHAYSNSNYVLLGMIIEKITKKPYSIALKERITDRLKLENTYCGGAADNSKNEARSYRYTGKQWEFAGETDMSIPLGAGMIVSTAEDLIHFIEGIFNYQLLSKETVEKMVIQQEGYGMGVFTVPFYERTGIGHNGRLDGFESVLTYFPLDKTTIALLANGVNTDLNEFLVGVLSIYFDKPYKIPTFYTYDVSEDILNEYAGNYHCSMLQLDFYITKEGNVIAGQAASQSAFPLDAKTETVFTYSPAGVEIEFKRNISGLVDQFILKQNGMEFIFTKLK